MDRSEPSLVPEWLRSTGSGSLSHNALSAKTDGPLLALPKRNRNLNSSSYSGAPHSSVLERSSSTNSRRSSSSNGSSKHDKNPPYSRSYSGSARNQRVKDRDKLGISDTWDSDYSDPLSNIIGVRAEKDALRRSQSMISRRPDEFRRPFTDSRNRGHNMNGNGSSAVSASSTSTGTQKVSFERDFPVLGSDERPATPDIARVPSPGLSRGVQGLSIGTSPLIGGEGWTSALAEVPVVGSSSIGSASILQSSPVVGTGPPPAPALSEASTSNGLNMAEALVLGPVRPLNVPQQSVVTQRFEELPSVGIKKLIPLTSAIPKTSVLNPSDKLKPKTATRSNDGVAGPKNGLQQMPSLQLGSQVVRGGSGRAEGLNSSSSKLQLLKPGREKVVSPALKDIPPVKVTSVVANGPPSTGSPSAASLPFKNLNNLKQPNNERKTSAYSLNGVQVVDKRMSHAQLQSRNDFFNLVRKKSMSGTSAAAAANSGAGASSAVQNAEEEKEMTSGSASPAGNGSELNCNGDNHNLAESFSDQRGSSDLSHHELIHPEEELDFLRALGWEDDGGDDEGLTEEEINAFYQKYMNWRPESKLLQGFKTMAESNSSASCSTGASSELRTADSSL